MIPTICTDVYTYAHTGFYTLLLLPFALRIKFRFVNNACWALQIMALDYPSRFISHPSAPHKGLRVCFVIVQSSLTDIFLHLPGTSVSMPTPLPSPICPFSVSLHGTVPVRLPCSSVQSARHGLGLFPHHSPCFFYIEFI